MKKLFTQTFSAFFIRRECKRLNVVQQLRPFASLANNEKDTEINLNKEDEKITALKTVFKCSDGIAANVYTILNKPRTNLDEIIEKVKYLRRHNIQMPIIIDNCQLLLKPLDEIKENFDLLKSMKWTKSDDFLPLLILDRKVIDKLQTLEYNRIRKRVYELAEIFSAPPHVVSKNCAKNPFVLSYDHQLLQNKIKILCDYNMALDDILHDLRGLTPSEEFLKERLDYIVANGLERCLPWMMRCTLGNLKRVIKRRQELSLEQNRTMDYLGLNLKISSRLARKLTTKTKFLQEIDCNKLDPVLKFLLKYFTTDQIAKNIYLLNKTLPELQRRIKETEAAGIEKPDPKYFGKSKVIFERYLKDKMSI